MRGLKKIKRANIGNNEIERGIKFQSRRLKKRCCGLVFIVRILSIYAAEVRDGKAIRMPIYNTRPLPIKLLKHLEHKTL
jgi:hypothetical protein